MCGPMSREGLSGETQSGTCIPLGFAVLLSSSQIHPSSLIHPTDGLLLLLSTPAEKTTAMLDLREVSGWPGLGQVVSVNIGWGQGMGQVTLWKPWLLGLV